MIRKKRRRYHLNLKYIEKDNKLFAIQNHWDIDPRCRKYKIRDPTNEYSSKCGLYDFDKNEWNKIKPFKWESYQNENFYSVSCFNEMNNSIYKVNNTQFIGKYNFTKNKWIYAKIEQDNLLQDSWKYFQESLAKPLLFIESNKNILHLFNAFKMGHSYIDLRQKNKKWINDDIPRDQIEFLKEDVNGQYRFESFYG